MKRLQDKVAVVTGAAKGIGAATARRFHAEGAFVALLDVDPAGANVLDQGRSLFIHCDVSRGLQVQAAIEEVVSTFGELEILVNNAGIQHYGTRCNHVGRRVGRGPGCKFEKRLFMRKICYSIDETLGTRNCRKRSERAEPSFSAERCTPIPRASLHYWD